MNNNSFPSNGWNLPQFQALVYDKTATSMVGLSLANLYYEQKELVCTETEELGASFSTAAPSRSARDRWFGMGRDAQ